MKRTLATTVAAAATMTLVAIAGPAPAQAAADRVSAGYAGKCTGADASTGTTIVVDFQKLNGNGGTPAATITRCSPNANPGTARTGIKAMQDAGITPVGTARYGLAFVCRINGRPSATESLPVTGNPTYKEGCVNTPSASAYWGYWYADGRGSTWTYSSQGASTHTVVPGGFEGWSFAINATSTTNPKPRVTPHNPALSATPSVTLGIADRAITLGRSTTLSWTSVNTTRRTASASPSTGAGTWSGALSASGSTSVTPTRKGAFTYTITGVKAGARATASTTLTVR